jgi:hypothetical protein
MLRMKITHITIACFALFIVGSLATASAEPTLQLEWAQNSGFNMKTGITGTWTIKPTLLENETIANVSYVEFYLDNQLQANQTSVSFAWSFDTANFAEGTHSIKVIAVNEAGEAAVAEEQRVFSGFPLISVVGVLLFASLVFAFVLLFSWFWIHDKARKRKIARATVGS